MEISEIKDDNGFCSDNVKNLDRIKENLPINDVFQAQADIFKALSDPTRLKILNILSKGELCACELIYVLNTPQSTTSHHLNVLKSVGLIKSRKEGVWIHYKLSDPRVHKIIHKLVNGSN